MSDNCEHNYQYVRGQFQCDKCGNVTDNGNVPPIQNSNFSRNAVIIGAICIIGIVGVSLAIMIPSGNMTEPTSESILDDVLPDVFQDPIHTYVVIDDEYEYGQITKSAISDWTSLNPDLKFEEMSKNYADVDFKIIYRDFEFESYTGEYWESGGVHYSYFDDTGKRINVRSQLEVEGSKFSTILIDTKIRDCRGIPQQYTHTTIKDTTKWAIGSYLGLGNHTDENHLMYNDDPNSKIPYDDLGYNIPDGIDTFYTIAEIESEIELEKLEKQIIDLEIKLSSYSEPIVDANQYAQYERQYDKYETLLEAQSKEIDHYNCLIAIEPVYDGIPKAVLAR